MIKNNSSISESEIEKFYIKLKKDTELGGYFLNPDRGFTRELIKGLLTNQDRYGYLACPCRLASGQKEDDLDIICPCYYRDPDLDEFGTCFCALYVNQEIFEGRKKIRSIPDRRYIDPTIQEEEEEETLNKDLNIKYPAWRCMVCGYLCARKNPPEICPICKAKKERFEIYINM